MKTDSADAHDDSEIVLEFAAEGAAPLSSSQYQNMGWKGFDDVEPIDDQSAKAVAIGSQKLVQEDKLDMTPMVDVTFLLLIFFMMTASFAIQKSFQQPPPHVDGQSPVPEQDRMAVLIGQDNTFYVTSEDQHEIECPSEREMWSRVREAKEKSNFERMTIVAHVDSMHKKVISAWDAGVVAGIENISIETTEEEL